MKPSTFTCRFYADVTVQISQINTQRWNSWILWYMCSTFTNLVFQNRSSTLHSRQHQAEFQLPHVLAGIRYRPVRGCSHRNRQAEQCHRGLDLRVLMSRTLSISSCLLLSTVSSGYCFFNYQVLRLPYILCIKLLYHINDSQVFSPVNSLSFHPFSRVFGRAKFLILTKSSFSSFSLTGYALGVASTSSLPNPRSHIFSLMFTF